MSIASEADDHAERVLAARIDLDRTTFPWTTDSPKRYCETLPRLAKHYRISEKELAAAYMRHNGPTLAGVMSRNDL